MSSADENMPDFDSMSPEELMAWMETLAERQGATEGFTTDKRVDVPEVDPDSVDQSQLGEYIPYGMDPEKWRQMQAEEEAKKQAALQAKQQAAQPEPQPEPQPPAPAQPVAEAEPQAELPSFDDDSEAETISADLDWLESLSEESPADVGEIDLAELDAGLQELAIEGLGDDVADPMDWLENLAKGEDTGLNLPDFEAETAADEQEVVSPLESGDNPIEWLESLARRQGADDEELLTEGGLDVPLPADVQPDGPGYTDYSVDEEIAEAVGDDHLPDAELGDLDAGYDLAELEDLEDPEAWLESLAAGGAVADTTEDSSADEAEDESVLADPKVANVISALDEGKDVAPDEIRGMMESLFDKAASRTDVEDWLDEDEEEYDPDAPAVPIELPDWLTEQVGPPPEDVTAEEVKSDVLNETIETPPDAVEMPDWLTETGDVDIDDIFADVEAEADEVAITVTDDDDPWVEAFRAEREKPDELERWYEEKAKELTGEEPASTAASATAAAPSVTLEEAELPEEDYLDAGEEQPLPDWLAKAAAETPQPAASEPAAVETPAVETPAVAEATPVAEMPDWLADSAPEATEDMPDWLRVEDSADEDVPDWLQEADIEPEEVPDWLKETLDTSEQETVSPEPATPQAQPKPAAVASKAISPAPTPAINIDVAATLKDARDKFKAGDIEGCLQAYEMVIRANAELEAVTKDLRDIAGDKDYKENPAIYRVLGDTLMRMGRLQEALQTYQRALNLL